MRIAATDDFQVTWPDPEMQHLPWLGDRMHFPEPLPRLAWGVVHAFEAGVLSAPTFFANGYQFSLPPTLPEPTPEIRDRGLGVWDDEYVPRIRAFVRSVAETDFDAMSLVELEARLDGWIDQAMDNLRLTMVVVSTFMAPTFGLISFLETRLGADGPVLAGTILQAADNATADAGAGLGELAARAARHPALAEALRAGRVDGLDKLPGGAAFLADLHAYLEEYGWRAESWGVMHRPTWAEDQTVPLALIGRYIEDPDDAPAAAMARAVTARAAAVAEAESRLAAEDLAEFRGLVEATKHHVGISEGRARWQLTLVGILRLPILALGRKLVAAGALESPEDVFYLDRETTARAAASPSPAFAAEARRARAEYDHWRTLTPPPLLGTMPDLATLPPEMAALARYFFGLAAPAEPGTRAITGFGASAGRVTGRARVIRQLGEADRLEPGDILVCVSTSPPWTSLFAIAGAIVTDTGGVMSHSAICAREFAIPCVVGTQAGTRLIPDGATITVDGQAGRVEVHPA